MKRLLRIFVLGAALAAVFPDTVLGAEGVSPLLGTWQLDRAKSTFKPQPGPNGQIRTYERVGDAEKLTAKGIDAAGKPTLVRYTARYDGKDYPIAGSSGGDLISLQRIDDFTTQSTQKRAGKAVIFATRTVSKDGKTLTVTTKGTTVKGEPIDAVMIFEKR
ncbi:MAG: hypothetical protein JWM63_4476 [Gammaproteobacteria bacterium]|nr:hypothetical protein [Gammaproteobacteria bacterium]